MAYIFNEISIGNLTDVQETDSYLYAQDHSNFIARYGYKELTHIYRDSLVHRKPINISYTKGPSSLSNISTFFSSVWSIYSDIQRGNGLYLRRLDPPLTYYLPDLYPSRAEILDKSYGMVSSALDMSATPVISFESGSNEITTLRMLEGLITWAGYSPMVLCNVSFVPLILHSITPLDTVVLYLKDKNETIQGWNYDIVKSKDEQLRDDQDTRSSNIIYMRFQRDNFGVEYTVCTVEFDIAYIENVWFDGDPDIATSADFMREYCLYVSLRDHNRNRYTLKSAPYYIHETSNVDIIYSYTSLTSSISDGFLFDTILTENIESDSTSLTSIISFGVLNDAIITETIIPESTGLTSSISSCILFDLVNTQDIVNEEIGMTSTITSGTINSIIVGDPTSIVEVMGITSGISIGSLVTV